MSHDFMPDHLAAWSDVFEQDEYDQTVMSVTPSTVVQGAVLSAVKALPEGAYVLVHGSGDDDIIPSLIAQCPNVARVTCVDLPSAVERAQVKVKVSDTANAAFRDKIEYVGMDYNRLGDTHPETFDAAVAINSFVQPSEEENMISLHALFNSLKPSGKLVGLFPTIEYSQHIAANDLKGHPWKKFVMGFALDKHLETLTSPKLGPQHFPTKSTLGQMLFDAHFDSCRISRLTMDDAAALEQQRLAYNKPIYVEPEIFGRKFGPFMIADFTDVAFSPVFENFVIAEKPDGPAP